MKRSRNRTPLEAYIYHRLRQSFGQRLDVELCVLFGGPMPSDPCPFPRLSLWRKIR